MNTTASHKKNKNPSPTGELGDTLQVRLALFYNRFSDTVCYRDCKLTLNRFCLQTISYFSNTVCTRAILPD